MLDAFRERLLSWLRIPQEPSLPHSEAEADVLVFRAGTRYYHYSILKWLLKQFGALLGIALGFLFLRVIPDIEGPWLMMARFAEAMAIIGFVLQAPVTYAMVRLDYDLRWYVVTDRSLRIREGLTTLREQTMTFANIQNISISQGPLQRLLGISDVEVHAAGGGGGGDQKKSDPLSRSLHVSVFRGVDNANDIRDLLRARTRRYLGSGLGDPDEQHPDDLTEGSPWNAESALAEAANSLLSEVRALRAAAT